MLVFCLLLTLPMGMFLILYTVWCHYTCNTVNYLQYLHNRHRITWLRVRGMGCLLWVQTDVLLQLWQYCMQHHVNSSPPGQNGRHFDAIFKGIFLNENDSVPIQISPKFVPKSPIDNKPALVQVMAWRRTGDKPLPEPMMTQFTDA